jgi:hypothetical protein
VSPKQARNLPIGALLYRSKPDYCAGYLILARKEENVLWFQAETMLPGEEGAPHFDLTHFTIHDPAAARYQFRDVRRVA